MNSLKYLCSILIANAIIVGSFPAHADIQAAQPPVAADPAQVVIVKDAAHPLLLTGQLLVEEPSQERDFPSSIYPLSPGAIANFKAYKLRVHAGQTLTVKLGSKTSKYVWVHAIGAGLKKPLIVGPESGFSEYIRSDGFVTITTSVGAPISDGMVYGDYPNIHSVHDYSLRLSLTRVR